MTGMITAIVGGRVVPVEAEPIDGGTVLLDAGKIVAIEGPGYQVPDGAEVIGAAGKWVLPGFIDAHAHVGVHEEAEGWAGQDTNEMTEPVTACVRALDAINPADEGFRDALAAVCWRSTSTRVPATRSAARPWRSRAGAAPWTRWCCASRPA